MTFVSGCGFGPSLSADKKKRKKNKMKMDAKEARKKARLGLEYGGFL